MYETAIGHMMCIVKNRIRKRRLQNSHMSRNRAAIICQRHVREWLYHPDGPMVKRLKKRDYNAIFYT